MLTTVIAFFLNSYYSGKFLGYSSWMQIKDIAPSYGLATLVALCVFCLKCLPITYWLTLPLQLLLGCAIVSFICKRTQMEEYLELKTMVEPYLKKIKK